MIFLQTLTRLFQNIQEIRKLKEIFNSPFLFVTVSNIEPSQSTDSLTESEQHLVERNGGQHYLQQMQNLRDQLIRLGKILSHT